MNRNTVRLENRPPSYCMRLGILWGHKTSRTEPPLRHNRATSYHSHFGPDQVPAGDLGALGLAFPLRPAPSMPEPKQVS